MQTFLPYSDFKKSAESLDYRRLGKQRVEALQILRSLLGIKDGWKNHPAVKMWRGHEQSLISYGLAICDEWIARGYRDSQRPVFFEMREMAKSTCGEKIVHPSWLGDDSFHLSHRSNLVRKNPEHYAPQFPGVPDDLPYIWPEG